MQRSASHLLIQKVILPNDIRKCYNERINPDKLALRGVSETCGVVNEVQRVLDRGIKVVAGKHSLVDLLSRRIEVNTR